MTEQLLMALAAVNGGYMLLDGLHVLVRGRYIGPERPGPWAVLPERLGVDVLRLGPVFVALGLLWLAWLAAYVGGVAWAEWLGVASAVLTLWYLPVGTLISAITLVVIGGGWS